MSIDRSRVQAALTAIKRYADYEAFFDELDSPEWLEPLAAEGLFKDPPEPVNDGKYVKFPIWPESRYLARMAPRAPEAVMRIVLEVPSTENVRVHEDLVDAASAMPVEVASKITAQLKTWLESPYQLLLPEKAGQFLAKLSEGGAVNLAVEIAKVLLAVHSNPRQTPKGEDDAFAMPPDPVGRFHDWEYEQILTKYVPVMAKAAPLATLDLLCAVLDEAVAISRPKETGGEDFSYVWRSAIEDHPLNTEHGLRGPLVSAVRDTAESLLAARPDALVEVLERLERYRWKVFHRIALHLLRLNAVAHVDLVSDRLMSPDRMEDLGIFHEFWLLAKAGLPLLDSQKQNEFLACLDAKFQADENDAESEDTPEQRDEARQFAKAWLYRRLSILGSTLPSPWSERLAALQAELGNIEHPDFLSYMTGATWVGPTSPQSGDDLTKMSVAEVIAFLRSWQPTGDRASASPEGLGRTLTGVVANAPADYAASADEFTGLDPTYVRALLAGLQDALKGKRGFAWPPVLKLCEWVVLQPREIPGRTEDRYGDLDPGWSWARKAIADLIAAGCEPGEGAIPIEQRESVWQILNPLTDDPDPTPEHEARYGGSNMDPFTLSINTTRGGAMHAVLQYGLWVRRHFERDERASDLLASGFNSMAEVRGVLDNHLNPDRDPSQAVRAVYGRWFPWLVLLDKEWARERVSQIFTPKTEQRDLLEAAWDAYLFYGGTFDSVLELLSPEYAKAIDRIGDPREARRHPEKPEERLAEHLMVFYWRGKLPIENPHGLIVKFFAKAPAALRGSALAFVGRVLQNDDNPAVPEPVLSRLQSLWNWRLREAAQAPAADRIAELSEFGWWYASRKFPEDWALDQLLQVLRATHHVEATHLVVEALVPAASLAPGVVAEALWHIVDGIEESWGLSLWHAHAVEVMQAILGGPDAQAREKVVETIHLLGAKGYRDFERLLPRADGTAAPASEAP